MNYCNKIYMYVYVGEFFIWDVLMIVLLWVLVIRRACGGGVSLRRMIFIIRGLFKFLNFLLFIIFE